MLKPDYTLAKSFRCYIGRLPVQPILNHGYILRYQPYDLYFQQIECVQTYFLPFARHSLPYDSHVRSQV